MLMNNRHRYSLIAPVFCFLFGLVSLFVVIAAGDGTWFFYARDFLNGKRIYSDMHLVQQPMFILVNAIGLSMFGTSYIGQKLIFVIILSTYVFFSFKLVSKAQLGDLFGSALFLFFFFTGIHFEAYRFDDYHIFANSLSLGLMLIFIKWLEAEDTTSIGVSILAGFTTALCILTRINDGLILIPCVLAFFLLRRRSGFLKVRDLLVFICAIVATCFVVFLIIHENLTSWLYSTIIDSAGAKGGARLFLAPINLVYNSFDYLLNAVNLYQLSLFIALLSILFALYLSVRYGRWLTSIPLLVLLMSVFYLSIDISKSDPIILFTALTICAIFVFLIYKAFQIISYKYVFNKPLTALSRESVLLVPISLFISGSLSTGGYHYGLYFPFALFIVTSFIVFGNEKLKRSSLLPMGVIVLFFIAGVGFVYRFHNPYSWHSYRSSSLLSRRYIINTNHMGYVAIDRELFDFISPVCKAVKETNATLLSIPFPFANYICGRGPWHDYVQTFFDTTPKGRVDLLLSELSTYPPDLIFYQRQLENLSAHEIIFSKGNALPHRALDHFIVERIEHGDWNVVYSSHFGIGNTWLLIDTRRPRVR